MRQRDAHGTRRWGARLADHEAKDVLVVEVEKVDLLAVLEEGGVVELTARYVHAQLS